MEKVYQILAVLEAQGDLKKMETVMRSQIFDQVEFSQDPQRQRDELQATTRFFSNLREIIKMETKS